MLAASARETGTDFESALVQAQQLKVMDGVRRVFAQHLQATIRSHWYDLIDHVFHSFSSAATSTNVVIKDVLVLYHLM
jgi:hypothetical protein